MVIINIGAWNNSNHCGRDVLPTKLQLQARGVGVNQACYLCLAGKESISHLFSECPYITLVIYSARLMAHPMMEGDLVWLEVVL